jgi:hypothetical protein
LRFQIRTVGRSPWPAMAAITIPNLLNPLPEDSGRYHQLPSPSSTHYADERYSLTPAPKKQKISKDAPVFTKGNVKGVLRYAPCEYQNAPLAEAHRKFMLHPMGRITEYPRHIPYNSEKKSFLNKTGRHSFEGKRQSLSAILLEVAH